MKSQPWKERGVLQRSFGPVWPALVCTRQGTEFAESSPPEGHKREKETPGPSHASFRAFHSAWRTLQGMEAVNMLRGGQISWLPKNDTSGQAAFVVAPGFKHASVVAERRVRNSRAFDRASMLV